MNTAARLLLRAGTALLLLLPGAAWARIDGPCSDCHTDANGPQEAVVGALWRRDCVSCHAMGMGERIVTLPGGDQLPQVFHDDPAGDLAGGNFRYLLEDRGAGPGGSRKGHDVADLLPLDNFAAPPGFAHRDRPGSFRKLTCAGVNGCHGLRHQLGKTADDEVVPAAGMAAIKGAHHHNHDGRLEVADTVAGSYRFLMGLRGLENPAGADRWQNATPSSHNEYYGAAVRPGEKPGCPDCHAGAPERSLDSYITTPRHSMSGFCTTCHGNYHAEKVGVLAFLRHPADYVIPAVGEYAAYTSYELTAPVARPTVYDAPSNRVLPGSDLVMCLSCHMAHASPYDDMLRFDFKKLVAGHAGEETGTGCFACHSGKGF